MYTLSWETELLLTKTLRSLMRLLLMPINVSRLSLTGVKDTKEEDRLYTPLDNLMKLSRLSKRDVTSTLLTLSANKLFLNVLEIRCACRIPVWDLEELLVLICQEWEAEDLLDLLVAIATPCLLQIFKE